MSTEKRKDAASDKCLSTLVIWQNFLYGTWKQSCTQVVQALITFRNLTTPPQNVTVLHFTSKSDFWINVSL